MLTKPDRERGERDHLWPEFLPGGKAVLFTITPPPAVTSRTRRLRCWICRRARRRYSSGAAATRITCRRAILSTASPARCAPWHSISDGWRSQGRPRWCSRASRRPASGAAEVAVAANGSLVYIPGGAGLSDQRTVVSVDRQGHPSPLPGLPLDSYRDVRVSPDGARLALATQADLWIYDFTRATLSRPTTDPSARSPLWTPDGQRIIFTSRRAGYPELFWRPADGTGSDERLLARAKDLTSLRANGWSADGRQLLFTEVAGDQRDRADRHRAPVRREGAGEQRLTIGRLPRRTLDGLPGQRVGSNRRSMSSGIPSSELGNRSRPAAAVSRSGRRTAGNCSSAAWTPGR